MRWRASDACRCSVAMSRTVIGSPPLAAAVGAAAAALLAPDLATAYAAATVASVAAWAGAALDRAVGPAGLRAAGRWLLALLVGDLGLLATALGIGGEVGLVVAAL